MEVAIGLPNAVPGTTGPQIFEWARRAEARGFSSLGTIDRIAYDNHEPLTALAAAAAVTERVGLYTSVLLGPLRPNVAELAKRALTVNALSGGRMILGIGIGGREDDYSESGLEMSGRGEKIDTALERMTEIWEQGTIGPTVAGPPRLIVGGGVEASFTRAAGFGEGWIAGGSGPQVFAESVPKVREAWAQASREGEPRFVGLAYYSLGESAEDDARRYLGDYYAWLGEETAEMIVGAAVKDEEQVHGLLDAFEDAGCDELILFPCSADAAQVDLLAEAALER